MNNILVTGGAGFIGSHVVDCLIDMGHNVIVLDDLSGGFEENVNPKATFIKGSILDYSLIIEIFEKYKFDYVFHLAAYAAEGLSHFIKRFNYNNNLIGSVNLINQSVIHNVKCFVFTSSIAVYGKNQLPMREDMVPVPEDSYGIDKLAVEQELRACYEMFGLNYIVFRPHNVYGDRQNSGDKYRNVIGIFLNQIMQNKPMPIFGDGKQTRAFSYISDIAPIIANSINCKEAYREVFNIGADKEYSVLELVQEVARAMAVEPEIIHLDERNEVKHAFSDHSKIKKYFQVPTPIPLSLGIDKMVKWAKVVGVKESKKFDNIEVMKNFPKGWL